MFYVMVLIKNLYEYKLEHIVYVCTKIAINCTYMKFYKVNEHGGETVVEGSLN